MNRFLFSPRIGFQTFCRLLVGGVLATQATAWAQTVTYDVRVQTGQKIKAVTGDARQGSFGAPSINDKGNVAFACVLSGDSIDAFTSFSVVFKAKGKKPAKVAFQSGIAKIFNADSRAPSDSFLRDTDNSSDVNPLPGSGFFYRIGRDVAMNASNKISFAGQFIETMRTVERDDQGNIKKTTDRDQSLSSIGEILPSGSKFRNNPIITYVDYTPEVILKRTASINKQGAVPYNALFIITPEETLPGFAYTTPSSLTTPGKGRLVATTASRVIGLDYDTTFDSFSDALIANDGICFVVANLSNTGADFEGIWQGNNPDLQPVVVLQNQAPTGGNFVAFDGKIGPSPNAQFAAFIANVSGGSVSRGVFRTTLDGKSIVNVASIGQDAPGTGGVFTTLTLASVNDRGYVALLGEAAVDSKRRAGIWLSDPAGKNLRLIIRVGQTIKIGPTSKTVRQLAFSPVSGLNKTAQVAFTATFTDRTSAVIVAK